MPRCAISFSQSALQDFQDIRAWYTEEGVPAVAERLIREIFDHVELLREQPMMGRQVPEFQQSFLRELVVPPFRVVYRHEASRVRVVRVWRSERLLRISEDDEPR